MVPVFFGLDVLYYGFRMLLVFESRYPVIVVRFALANTRSKPCAPAYDFTVLDQDAYVKGLP